MRILIASILSMAVILLWAKFFAPKPPANLPQANRTAITAPAAANPAASPSSTTPGAAAKPSSAGPAGVATGIAPSNAAAKEEPNIVVENELYRVEFSNRGGVVKSWQLKNYKDDSKPQRVLDVVHPDASQQTGGWPCSVILDDVQLQNAANQGLFQISSPSVNLHAPADVVLAWSDGHLEVTKHFKFDHSYVVQVETAAKLNGNPIKAGLGWLGGFGDLTVTNPAPVETISTFYSESGKV